MSEILALLLAPPAIYWLTKAITSSDGPLLLFARLRRRLALFSCFICTSFWAGLLVYLSYVYAPPILYTLGFVGLANIVNDIINRGE